MISCASCVLDLKLFGGWVRKKRERGQRDTGRIERAGAGAVEGEGHGG